MWPRARWNYEYWPQAQQDAVPGPRDPLLGRPPPGAGRAQARAAAPAASSWPARRGRGRRQPSDADHASQPAPPRRRRGCCARAGRRRTIFKYMRAEFGLDSLPEHALEEVDGEAWIVNPAWRRIDKALKQERNTVGHLRRKRAAQQDARSQAARELDTRIQACDRTVAGLERARRTADTHIQARDLPEGEKLQALPAALRQLHDTLRMIAYRAESAMALAVAPELDSPDTARSLLKALFRSDASLRPDPAAGTLTVRLLHLSTRAQDQALAPLLEELNRTRTVFPGTQLRLVYEMPPSEPSRRTVALPRPTAPTPLVAPP